MISYLAGDLLCSHRDAVVNPCNCVGVMGKGLALQFRRAYPEMFREYQDMCRSRDLRPGTLHWWGTGRELPRYVVNFPTKDHWSKPSRMEWVIDGLRSLVAEAPAYRIQSIAMPALGCGLGGLDWSAVRAVIERAFGSSDLEVDVYLPQ